MPAGSPARWRRNLQQIALQQSLRKPTDNLDAYDMLLRGRAMAGETTRSGNRMAREMVEKAMAMAPNYADAYAELADIHFERATFGWSEFVQQDIDTAIRYAQKAIDLDEESVLARGVLARAYAATQKYDLALAESERALDINPSDADVLLARAAVLLWTGRIEESIATAEIALRLNPNIGPEAALNLGIAYLLKGRYADAVKLLEAVRAAFRPIRCSTCRWPAPMPRWAARPRPRKRWKRAAQESASRRRELRHTLPGPGAATPRRGQPAQGRTELTQWNEPTGSVRSSGSASWRRHVSAFASTSWRKRSEPAALAKM